MKGYLSFAEGFFGPMGREAGKKKRYMDWEKCKAIVDAAVKENPNCEISVGLMEDWGCTSCVIRSDGAWVMDGSYRFYGESIWATPIVDIDGQEIECWTYEETKERFNLPEWVKYRSNGGKANEGE